MQKITASMLIDKACELLANHTVERVLGWKIGEFAYDVTPAIFTSVEELKTAADIVCTAVKLAACKAIRENN